MKKPWRITRWPALALAIAFGYSAYRLAWGKPFTACGRAEQLVRM